MKKQTIDGNTACCHISYMLSELAFIYPITPSSPMAEQADIWRSQNIKNIFDGIPQVIEMQSEAGVAGALHGALTCGALATTYTSSQGLLLMIPNMYKIAGELLPTVIHVSARAIATHALNIFGDHQDVMATRQTGFCMLCSSNVQECMDFSVAAHLASLRASLPFLHFFDGFRTSHEIQKIDVWDMDDVKKILQSRDIKTFKNRALNPKKPCIRGTTQNGDIYFQNRERANEYYQKAPTIVQEIFDEIEKITSRKYQLFDYFGTKNAEMVVVTMGSSGDTMYELITKNQDNFQAFGVIKVRLYRPFDSKAFVRALPQNCKRIAVLDRTKESGSVGEPLYLDVCAALAEQEANHIEVIGGRYGLGGKEFTPAMAYAVLLNLQSTTPKNHFTVGINDDCTHTSLDYSCQPPMHNQNALSCIFYGLGSDGSVGANKNTAKIIGDHTPFYAQAYFCYDSRKSGGITISHLRFSPSPIHAPYLIEQADYIACHAPSYLTRLDMLKNIKQKGTFILNCPWKTIEELDKNLPLEVKYALYKKQLRFFVIDATKIARDTNLGGRTSSIMQAAFFYLQPQFMPYQTAISHLKQQLEKTLNRKGKQVIEDNFSAINQTEQAILAIEIPERWNNQMPPTANRQDNYYDNFMSPILRLEGDTLPVSAFSPDGSTPTATTRLEKHGAPALLPKWLKENCIQCNQCSYVCPHACIRPFITENAVENTWEDLPAAGFSNQRFRIQVSPNDCMGCGVCADVCPTKEKALVMQPSQELLNQESANWEYAMRLPPIDYSGIKRNTVKGSQFYPPLFEFSYACAGCGETPYIKLLTQLFGERMVIANATGCSSIYGGNAPACPYSVNFQGKGPAWANSLFEDNSEFGLGMYLANVINGNLDHSIWIIGGDGWAYDIGYGGLDHVLASGANVNVLVLDSEVYSNTGGQMSKATAMGASARFASLGKQTHKKPLGLIAMQYQNVYVAQVSMGANKAQLLQAFTEAETYNGPSLIIAYSPCIAHGVSLSECMREEIRAVKSGYWPLYRYNPTKQAPLHIDSAAPDGSLREFFNGEGRFSPINKDETLFTKIQKMVMERYALLQHLAQFKP